LRPQLGETYPSEQSRSGAPPRQTARLQPLDAMKTRPLRGHCPNFAFLQELPYIIVGLRISRIVMNRQVLSALLNAHLLAERGRIVLLENPKPLGLQIRLRCALPFHPQTQPSRFHPQALVPRIPGHPLKLFLWMGLTPNRAMADRCSRVPYPLCRPKPYRGRARSYACMIRSRATLARMEAAEMEKQRRSPEGISR